MCRPIALKQIPRRIKNPIQDKGYLHLIGAVKYIGQGQVTKHSNNISTTHYTAVCPRGEHWYEYENLTAETISRKKTDKIVLFALIYTKHEPPIL